MIRVLLVDDSPVVLAVLKRLLAVPDSGVEVVATARNGAEALILLEKAAPQVICTDLTMPVMDGLTFTREVMRRFPRPILLLSAAVEEGQQRDPRVFQVLEAGAVDVMAKPRVETNSDLAEIGKALLRKIRILSGVHVLTRRDSGQGRAVLPCGATTAVPTTGGAANGGIARVVAIGASTGGPQALQAVLGGLLANFPIPIVAVQHISDGFNEQFLEWLNERCRLTVTAAVADQMAQPGHVYFAPERRHLIIDGRGRFSLETAAPGELHCPSVSRLFQSVVRGYGGHAAGILLTGMGGDGADGLLALRQAGAVTVAQSEDSCVVFGMPQKAIALGGACCVMPLAEIADFVTALGEKAQRQRGKP